MLGKAKVELGAMWDDVCCRLQYCVLLQAVKEDMYVGGKQVKQALAEESMPQLHACDPLFIKAMVRSTVVSVVYCN